MDIKANIHDLNNVENYDNKPFLVDTNIWLWLTYTKIMPTRSDLRNKVIQYTDKIIEMQLNGAVLVYSALTFSEIATSIEKQEMAEHIEGQNPDFNLNESKSKFFKVKKILRNDSALRNKVAMEVKSSLTQLTDVADRQADDNLTKFDFTKFADDLKETTLDGTDILLNNIGAQEGLNVITDDRDYGSVNGLNVFTLNKDLI